MTWSPFHISLFLSVHCISACVSSASSPPSALHPILLLHLFYLLIFHHPHLLFYCFISNWFCHSVRVSMRPVFPVFFSSLSSLQAWTAPEWCNTAKTWAMFLYRGLSPTLHLCMVHIKDDHSIRGTEGECISLNMLHKELFFTTISQNYTSCWLKNTLIYFYMLLYYYYYYYYCNATIFIKPVNMSQQGSRERSLILTFCTDIPWLVRWKCILLLAQCKLLLKRIK